MNQRLEVGVVSAGCIACMLALGGCSSYGWGSSERDASESASTAVSEPPAEEAAPGDDRTATEAVADAEGAAQPVEEAPAAAPGS
ncbi:MAG TPA: hypothetical protein VJ011_01470, partial [Steroidobacteraceae bacterium]|nr:hypothetical protein [Steroidobacteraceae bacterium]